MASNSKRLKSCSNSKRLKPCSNHEDRISGLPDEILCHILSFLFTREAVKTSVLSHRWTNVWTSVPILDLDEEEFHIDFKRRALPKGSQLIRHVPDWFAQYVNRVLLFRCPGDIQRFRLVVGRMDDVSLIYAWIATAIRRNVVELDLAVGITRKPNFEIPKRLFMCSTLVRLKLWLHRYTRVMTPTSSNCFPSLKFFHVAVLNPGSDSMVKLFSRCLPVLEELIIDGKLDTTAFNPNISAPKLKRLQIKLAVHKVNMIAAADHYVYYVCRTFINVDAPNLEEFDICFDAMVSFSLKNAKRLRKAKIDFFKEITDHDCFPGLADRIHQICAGICDAKYLTVKAPIFAALDIGYRRLLPTFKNLNKLELQLQTCRCLQSLATLLRISPNLEHLRILPTREHMHVNEYNYCDDDNEDVLVHEWDAPEFAHISLISHLKTVCLWDFKGCPNEVEVAKYLVKHGKSLNKVTIHFRFGENKEMKSQSAITLFSSQFLKFPRGSKTCEVEFQMIS